VVAQPLRRAEELVALWLCVAPLRLGGLRGKKSTPSVWLGGTGESSKVGMERERHGAGAGRSGSAIDHSDSLPSVTVRRCIIFRGYSG
jgi:hypothetical protein